MWLITKHVSALLTLRRDAAKRHTERFPGAKYKAFPTETEARHWFNKTAIELRVPALLEQQQPPSTIPQTMTDNRFLRSQFSISPTAQTIYTDGACLSN